MLPGDKSALAAASDDLSNSSYCWTVHRQSASTNRFLLAPPDDLYSPESSASEFGAANLSEQLAQSKNDSPATHLNNPSLAPDSEIMMWLFAGYRPPSHQTDAGIPADQLGSSSEATTGTGQGDPLRNILITADNLYQHSEDQARTIEAGAAATDNRRQYTTTYNSVGGLSGAVARNEDICAVTDEEDIKLVDNIILRELFDDLIMNNAQNDVLLAANECDGGEVFDSGSSVTNGLTTIDDNDNMISDNNNNNDMHNLNYYDEPLQLREEEADLENEWHLMYNLTNTQEIMDFLAMDEAAGSSSASSPRLCKSDTEEMMCFDDLPSFTMPDDNKQEAILLSSPTPMLADTSINHKQLILKLTMPPSTITTENIQTPDIVTDIIRYEEEKMQKMSLDNTDNEMQPFVFNSMPSIKPELSEDIITQDPDDDVDDNLMKADDEQLNTSLSSVSSSVASTSSTNSPVATKTSTTITTTTSRRRRGRPSKPIRTHMTPEELANLTPDRKRYREMRFKNNEASRKSRISRKQRDIDQEKERRSLEKQNRRLRQLLEHSEDLNQQMMALLASNLK